MFSDTSCVVAFRILLASVVSSNLSLSVQDSKKTYNDILEQKRICLNIKYLFKLKSNGLGISFKVFYTRNNCS